MKIGYSYAPLTINARTDKRIVSKNFSNESFLETFKENLQGLKKILAHNINNDIHLFRVTSDILEDINQYDASTDWTSTLNTELTQISNLIKNNNIRISMFPQKYTLLNSPNEEVVKKSIDFINAHTEFLKALKLDTSHKIVLEIGGVYTNKENSVQRFIDTYNLLSNETKDRIVLVNDVKNYSFEDVLTIAKEVNSPIILNTLYDKVKPSTNLTLFEKLEEVSKTWENTFGKMFVHYSQQKHSKKKGQQSDTIFTDKFLEFYNIIKKFDTDITLDVNDGDISTLKCQNIIKELQENKFDEKLIMEEYKKYKLLIVEKGIEFDKKALDIARSTNSIIEFYHYLDSILESFIDRRSISLALRDAIKIMSNSIKASEKNHIEKLLLNNKLSRCKSYMHEVAIRNNSEDILSTYFFSQI